MRSIYLALGLAAASTAIGQATVTLPAEAPISATSTKTNTPTVHTVSVSFAGSNAYSPNSLNASAGDIISFVFYAANHTVIRSAFGYPCIPYEDLGPGKQGFFSGYVPVVDPSLDLPVWNLTINDTQPIFYYCSAPNSCIGNGMVGVINPNSSNQITEQIKLAHQANLMLQPGEAFPNEGIASSASALASTATATVTATPTSSPTASSTPAASSKKLSSGAIAGIAVGAVAVLAIAGALFYLFGRNRRLKERITQRDSTMPHPETKQSPSSTLYPMYGGGIGGDPNSPPQADNRWSTLPPYAAGSPGVQGAGAPEDFYNKGGVQEADVGVNEVGSVRSASPGQPGWQGWQGMEGDVKEREGLLNSSGGAQILRMSGGQMAVVHEMDAGVPVQPVEKQ
ncbi:hypothetical protein M8818_006109 [Zalaria obscura]|uniref:Uncharacterized protein n=1 Tax=Zalaria obscura TaxID=2024903 RepID=A0ACC3S703_9PEZI